MSILGSFDEAVLDVLRRTPDLGTYIAPGALPWSAVRRMKETLIYAGSVDYSITGTSFADVDSKNLALRLTGCSGAPIRVRFGCFAVKGTTHTYISLALDGAEVTGGAGLVDVITAGGDVGMVSLPWTIQTITPGDHTLTLQAKVDAGTGTIYSNGVPITMEAEEV